MSKKEIVGKVKQYVEIVKTKFPVSMVILEKTYQGEEDKKNRIIEVAVVVDRLEKDYLEAKDELTVLAHQVDPRIDVDIIEREKKDSSGFFEEIRKRGEIIYKL